MTPRPPPESSPDSRTRDRCPSRHKAAQRSATAESALTRIPLRAAKRRRSHLHLPPMRLLMPQRRNETPPKIEAGLSLIHMIPVRAAGYNVFVGIQVPELSERTGKRASLLLSSAPPRRLLASRALTHSTPRPLPRTATRAVRAGTRPFRSLNVPIARNGH
jgi:hypothetical protein